MGYGHILKKRSVSLSSAFWLAYLSDVSQLGGDL